MSTLRVNEIQEADGSTFSRLLQVKNTNVTTTSSFTISSANTNFAVSALDTAITSTQANSKFIFSAQVFAEINGQDNDFAYELARVVGGTETYFASGTGSIGNRDRVTRNLTLAYFSSENESTPSATNFSSIVDSPNVAAGTAITYRINVKSTGGSPSWTFYLNRTVNDNDSATYERGASWLTVMEVATT
jgi:hypothetical protein|tara:strand:- start:4834 stop:5403 length:570 start_codon:yes stop_codon:yes gene_type:complete